MWHRFTGNLRNAICDALSEANGEGAKDLSTLHILTGLAGPRVGAAADILRRLGITERTLKVAKEAEAPAPTRERSLTPMAREAVERAYAEAVSLGDNYLGTEHFLLGLLRVPDGAAARALEGQGVMLQRAAEALIAEQPWRVRVPAGASVPGAFSRRLRAVLQSTRAKVKKLGRMAVALTQLPRDPIIASFVLSRWRIRNPYPFFRRMREIGFYFSQAAGAYIVADYEGAQKALREPSLSARRFDMTLYSDTPLPPLIEREFNTLCGGLSRQMLFLDAPEQTRLRSLVSRQFTPRVIEAMRTQVQKVTDRLLDTAEAKGRMDVIADFSFPLPATVIARLLGVCEDDLDQFRRWSDDFVRFIRGDNDLAADLRAYHSLRSLTPYFRQAIARVRAAPDDVCLLALFANAEDEDGTRLTEDEIIANGLLLLAAGHETTTHLIANGLLLLLQNPEQLRRIREDPSRMAAAVEEMLRCAGPVQWTSRMAKQDVPWNGQTIKRGEWVNVCLAAANREPARFPNPDAFDICREDNKHIAFGFGPHFCLGAALARMETDIALSTLLQRFPNLRLADREPHWRSDFTFRAQTKLPVTLR
jgi:cytochrome P450